MIEKVRERREKGGKRVDEVRVKGEWKGGESG